ncbi:shikimate dehydrogenase [uncultured Jatrophihabitans sp.]|uniref:shikimate dehydrogenase n=1 Tax=uncultured Jatrophihabitans sp. TaxID=1610747 RepID=UPI0035CA5540
MATSTGRRAGVLGQPVAHSLSPVLHRAAYAALGLDWTYEAIECGAEDLPGVLSERADWAGFSCTMPLKHAALEIAAEVRPLAGAVGSANTLLPGPDGWVADNTDVAGIVAALAEFAVAPRTVTVLGAGGTSQAVLAALLALGVPACTVLVRDPARIDRALDTAGRLGVAVAVETLHPDAAALGADLVVSTLPSGAADPFATRPWAPTQTLFDVAYDPWPSALAEAAGRGGARVISGALLLLHQAAVQVELMTGQEPPVDEMREALRAATPHAGL